jgi:hypothetical protein
MFDEFKGRMSRGLFLAVLLCIGCGAGADVHAVRDPHYAGRMRSIYLAIGHGGIDEDYATEFVSSFKRELGQRGVALTSRVITGLELDTKLIQREVAGSQADGVLFMVPVRGTTYYGEVTNLTWDVFLIDVRSGAKIWRARVENKKAAGAYGSTAGMVDEAAINIAKQLDSDRIIGGA